MTMPVGIRTSCNVPVGLPMPLQFHWGGISDPYWMQRLAQ